MAKEQLNRPTITQVAEDANVSIATVSRVINGRRRVSEDRAARVRASILKLGYRPNRTARDLRTQTATQKIGMILGDIYNTFFTRVLGGIQKTIINDSYVLMVGDSLRDPALEQFHFDIMLDEGVAGIIMHFGTVNPNHYVHLRDSGTPIVAFDYLPPGLVIDCVTINNLAAVKKATEHLIQIGHRELGFVGGEPLIPTAIERKHGFIAAVKEAGLAAPPERMQGNDYTVENGYRAMETLMDLPIPPTAVVASNNLTTVGALQLIQERRLRIPDDIAVIGFDDASWMTAFNPPLTVIEQHPAHIGAVAAEQLLARINDPKRPIQQVVLEADLIVRESCGASS